MRRYLTEGTDARSCGYCSHFILDHDGKSMCDKSMFSLATRSIAEILLLVKMAENCPEYIKYAGSTA